MVSCSRGEALLSKNQRCHDEKPRSPCINGQPTYQGRIWNGKKIEGLLLDSRMVQAIFDDLNPDTANLWKYPDIKELYEAVGVFRYS